MLTAFRVAQDLERDRQGPVGPQVREFIFPYEFQIHHRHSGVDTGSKLRPNQEELKEIGPDFAARWKSYYEKAEDKAVLWVGLIN